MAYYRPKKVIASAAGRPGKDGTPGAGAVVIKSDTEPTAREDGSQLVEGDFWWDTNDESLFIYIDGSWEVAGGVGALDTSQLQLTNATVTRFTEIPDSATLPPVGIMQTQENANLWFLSSLQQQDERIDYLEANIGGGPGGLTYEGEAPIVVDQQLGKVTHSFDISTLPSYTTHNPYLDKQKYRGSLNKSATREGAFTFEAIAPINVKSEDDTVTHGFRISDLNRI